MASEGQLPRKEFASSVPAHFAGDSDLWGGSFDAAITRAPYATTPTFLLITPTNPKQVGKINQVLQGMCVEAFLGIWARRNQASRKIVSRADHACSPGGLSSLSLIGDLGFLLTCVAVSPLLLA